MYKTSEKSEEYHNEKRTYYYWLNGAWPTGASEWVEKLVFQS